MYESTYMINRIWRLPLAKRILRHRFLRFGTVGLSGTIINVVVLYINQEYLLRTITPPESRLHFSLTLAIFISTLSNFMWNRGWTWKDRSGRTKHGFCVQMGQYFAASAIAILIQYVLTILLSYIFHYLAANILSIIVAAGFTYLVNDHWTFALRRN